MKPLNNLVAPIKEKRDKKEEYFADILILKGGGLRCSFVRETKNYFKGRGL